MAKEPADTPVTTPDTDTVASDVLVLDQVPPEVASLSDIVAPIQTDEGPVTAAGAPSTVTVLDTVVPQEGV